MDLTGGNSLVASGDEIWFTSSGNGSAANPRAVTLSGKLRTITNVPGGVWLQDMRNGTALMVTHQQRIGIRGMAPGGKEERELGWFGWSIVRDISRDGQEILFEEEGNGGGPNYTVFLRDTDGSPPVAHWRRTRRRPSRPTQNGPSQNLRRVAR